MTIGKANYTMFSYIFSYFIIQLFSSYSHHTPQFTNSSALYSNSARKWIPHVPVISYPKKNWSVRVRHWRKPPHHSTMKSEEQWASLHFSNNLMSYLEAACSGLSWELTNADPCLPMKCISAPHSVIRGLWLPLEDRMLFSTPPQISHTEVCSALVKPDTVYVPQRPSGFPTFGQSLGTSSRDNLFICLGIS